MARFANRVIKKVLLQQYGIDSWSQPWSLSGLFPIQIFSSPYGEKIIEMSLEAPAVGRSKEIFITIVLIKKIDGEFLLISDERDYFLNAGGQRIFDFQKPHCALFNSNCERNAYAQ